VGRGRRRGGTREALISEAIDPNEWVLHPKSAWSERADFVANVTIGDETDELKYEQLAFEQLGGDRYRLCSVPFFAYGLHLGDEVELERRPVVGLTPSRVVTRSDYWVLRAFVEPGESAQRLERLLREHDAAVEVRGRLVAFAVRLSSLEAVRRQLDEIEQAPDFSYETGWN